MNKILIVENNLDFATILKTMLVKNKFEVIGTAETSDTAIELATSLKPDLIISDFNLEDNTTGIDVANGVNVPIIICSSNANNIQKTLKMKNVCGFVTKPFNEDILIKMIRENLKWSSN